VVGLEREWLGGADLGHPGLHVLAGDAHEVRAVVDAQAVGVDLVHQVAGLARVQPLADHRPVADREADEHVEVLGGLTARGGGQKPAVGGGAQAHLRERLVGLGGRVDVAQRLVGDQQMPAQCLQLGRVAIQHAVRDQRDAGSVAELAVERAQLPGDRLAVVDDRDLDVRGQWRQPAAGGAVCELVAPLSE